MPGDLISIRSACCGRRLRQSYRRVTHPGLSFRNLFSCLLQLATDGMPQGDLITIPLTSNIGYQNQSHVIVHFKNADPDLGRKGLREYLHSTSGSAIATVARRCSRREAVKRSICPRFTPEVGSESAQSKMLRRLIMSAQMSGHPLRHIGPVVMISFDLRDVEMAHSLGDALAVRGCQVELLAHGPGEQGASRFTLHLLSCEAFVFLITAESARSRWPEAEFRVSTTQRSQRQNIEVIPLLAGPRGLVPTWLRDWACIEVPSGLSPSIEDLVFRCCLRSIEPLPFSPDREFYLAEDRVTALLSSPERLRKRVVVDAEGFLPSLLDEAVTWAERIDSPYRDDFRAKLSRETKQLEERLSWIDRLTPFYLEEVRAQFSGYGREFPNRGLKSVRNFTRLLMGLLIVESPTNWIPLDQSQLLSPLKDKIQTARASMEMRQARNPKPNFPEITWSLDVSEDDAAKWFEDVSLTAIGGKKDMRLWLPTYAMGSEEEVRVGLQFGDVPEQCFYQYDWTDYGMPQVALRVFHNAETGEDAIKVAERFGWKLSDYGRVGLS